MRVALLLPPAVEPVKTPLLAFGYLAAALGDRGHEALVVDCAAPGGPKLEQLPALVADLAPDLIGLHLKTLEVQPGYRAALELGSVGVPLVAGGPHASVCPDEALRQGFDYVLRGEAEASLPDLADALSGKRELGEVAGLSFVDRGLTRHLPEGPRPVDLDYLPNPLSALHAFDAVAYGADRPAVPAGLLSSRGCPAACTFCANNVTGRKFRFHSPERVAREVGQMVRELGRPGFAFFDDSFAVGGARLRKLCGALERVEQAQWTCTAHPAHLDRDVLQLMRRAGCGGLDIGLESGDADMLEAIGKGVSAERVLRVLEWAAELGIHTVVNLMVGWPDETEAQLEATLAFIERAAPLAGGFNARGVLVPHPGTELYDRYHQRFGFTEWWLRDAPIAYERFPAAWTESEVARAYASDAALERNFFDHDPTRLGLMTAVLEQKAFHTWRRVAAWAPPPLTVPAAGAR
ncbi:MAG: B12-binding domain-containing radical SAM protein [Myxococcales bacterium]|nr:B12-binding domain-containing radical SAM protein [Myxococcales bacterium]